MHGAVIAWQGGKGSEGCDEERLMARGRATYASSSFPSSAWERIWVRQLRCRVLTEAILYDAIAVVPESFAPAGPAELGRQGHSQAELGNEEKFAEWGNRSHAVVEVICFRCSERHAVGDARGEIF